jgi:glycosyltransferase involved in cell wall biosynthesis
MIFFVGPLPPPVHGFSVINAAMLARFQAAGTVAVFDRTPAPGRGRLGRLSHALALWARFVRGLRAAPPGSGLYIGLSGGLGQLMDLPFVLAARLLSRPVLVHHHSFAYLRVRPWHARWVLGLLRGARHIALCDCMADALTAAYRIPRPRVSVLSNAAFLPAPQAGPPPAPEPVPEPGVLSLGFLSNISAEKGIWAFLALGDALVAQGLAVRALVAGPPAAGIAARLAQELAERPWCRHLGAVYGADKADFLRRIDVLVFPTFYANEAEPVTVLEALGAGVPVLANQRGCLRELVPAGAGAVFADDAQFVPLAAARLQAWVQAGAEAWQQRRSAAQAAYAALQAEHSARLATIVAEGMRGMAA